MSSIADKVRQQIANIVKSVIKSSNLRSPKLCIVVGVSADVNDCMSCDVKTLDTGVLIEDVRLTADNNFYGFVLIPSVGSKVEVSFNTETDAFLSMVSKVDGIYLNGNNNGGLIKIQELLIKLNTIEASLNTIGVWGATVTPPLTLPPIIPTIRTELENVTVKHGTGTQI